jgi:hypothetical protein
MPLRAFCSFLQSRELLGEWKRWHPFVVGLNALAGILFFSTWSAQHGLGLGYHVVSMPLRAFCSFLLAVPLTLGLVRVLYLSLNALAGILFFSTWQNDSLTGGHRREPMGSSASQCPCGHFVLFYRAFR